MHRGSLSPLLSKPPYQKMPKREPLHRFHPQTTHRTTPPIPHTELHPTAYCLHNPLPLPSGGTSPKGRGKGLCANFKQHHKPEFIPPSIDTHQTLGSPSGRAGAKRLRGLTAPILPTSYPQNHPTNSSHERHFYTNRLNSLKYGRYSISDCRGG